jgi:hypothetical protein
MPRRERRPNVYYAQNRSRFDELIKQGLDANPSKAELMARRNEVVMSQWEALSPEVKAEITTLRDQQYEDDVKNWREELANRDPNDERSQCVAWSFLTINNSQFSTNCQTPLL